MKYCLLLALSVGIAGAAQPSDTVIKVTDEISYVIPRGSPVRYERTGEFYTVEYKGNFPLTGHYSYGYVTDNPADDATYGELQLLFTVSPASAARLPYWQRDRPVREIYIRNPDRFVQIVVGPYNLEKLRRREIKQINGVITIVVDKFETSIDCDHQTSSAEFVSVHGKPDRKVASVVAGGITC